jgi:hypothetical protein
MYAQTFYIFLTLSGHTYKEYRKKLKKKFYFLKILYAIGPKESQTKPQKIKWWFLSVMLEARRLKATKFC